jgi:hypothetical protein
MIAMSPSGGLIARLWRRCCDTARVWIPLGKDVTAEDVKSPQETSAKLAGRWPDAESLLARRMQSLDLDTPKDNAGDRKPNNNA